MRPSNYPENLSYSVYFILYNYSFLKFNLFSSDLRNSHLLMPHLEKALMPDFVRRRSPRRNDGAVSKLSTKLHKIKGALKPQTVDGQIFDTDVLPLEGDTEFVSF